MFYIDQLRTPSCPIGLVKTESGFVVRSVETGLGRGTLVVAVISADSYPFVAFSDLICDLEDTVQVFLEWTVPANSKETELEISNPEASLSAGKSSGCHVRAAKCVPTAISDGVDISEVRGYRLVVQYNEAMGTILSLFLFFLQKVETSCVLLKSYKHYFERSVITLILCSQIYIAFMFTLDQLFELVFQQHL